MFEDQQNRQELQAKSKKELLKEASEESFSVLKLAAGVC